MKKIIALGLVALLGSIASSFGGYGWYNGDTLITINDGDGDDSYNGAAFDSLTTLGTFDLDDGDTLTLNGFQNYNWADGGDNVLNGFSGYQVKLDGAADSSFTTINNTTYNNEGGNNESWASSGLGIELLSGLSAGNTYEVSFYSWADVDWNPTDGSADAQTYASNNGGNYRATFEVIPEPATMGLTILVGTGALFIRRMFMM